MRTSSAVTDEGPSAIGPARRIGGAARAAASRPQSWIDRWVFDARGDPLGVSVGAYADDASGRPTWLAVYTGRRAAVIAIVPVDGSSLLEEGVIIAHDVDTVLAAPHHPPALDPTRNALLRAHYRRRACAATSASGGHVS